MIISNEPGYYAAGAFGIRIENLLAVEERKIPGGERPMLGFETLTFAPIDLTLVDPKLMDAEEIAWLNDYHARVRKTLSPRVDAPTRRWLAKVDAAPRRGQAPGSVVERAALGRRGPFWIFLAPRHLASESLVFGAWKSLDFLGFSRPK